MLAPGVHNATVDDAFPLLSSFTTIVLASDRSQVKSKSAVVKSGNICWKSSNEPVCIATQPISLLT
jgi:hypothetical protein